jgi:hypothetical protein
MALNVAVQLYRGTFANLSALASTGKAGVLALATDTNQLYIDAGSGTAGIGAGHAWQRVSTDVTVQTAANQAARLALTAQVGDICLQTDNSTTYILTALPASTNGNWSAIGLATAPVTSVAGKTGAVTLAFTDITGTITQTQLPTTIGSGSSLTSVDCGSF